MSGKLPDIFFDTAILQFGYFVTDNKVAPFRFCPEYLPAYPHLLNEVSKLVATNVENSSVDRLIAMPDSVALGVVCSLQTGLSLVYSSGRGESAVYDLVGSYNSGHLTTLLVNCVQDTFKIEKFILNARSVGLEITRIVSLLEIRQINQVADIPVQSVFRLLDFVKELVAARRLSDGQGQAVFRWLENV